MKTFNFTSDAIGLSEPIIANTVCRKIIIKQNDWDSATIAFFTTCPTRSDAAIMRTPVEVVTFDNPMYWSVGQVIGYIYTNSGAIVFSQEES